jgi:broad specificity phosphatase PhoE
MLKFIDYARHTHPGGEVVAVTHGDPIRFLVGWAQGGSVETEASGMSYPATGSVVILTYAPGQDRPTLQLLSPPAERPV